jgi:hypothetical protein
VRNPGSRSRTGFSGNIPLKWITASYHSTI